MKKTLKYATFILQSSPTGVVASLLLSLCNILFAAGLYAMASFIISLAALHPTYDAMMIPVVCVRFFGIGRAVLSYSERYVSHASTFTILKKIRLRLYDKMLPKLPDHTQERGKNLSKLIADVELLQEGILRLLYPLFSSVFILLTGTVVAYWIHPYLAIGFACLFLINTYLVPVFLFSLNARKRVEIDLDQHRLYQDIIEMKEGIMEITSYAQEKEWEDRIENKLLSMNGNRNQYHDSMAFCEAVLVFLQGLSMFVILWIAVSLTADGELNGVYLAAIVLALTTLIQESMLPGQIFFKFNGLKRAAESVFEDDVRQETKNTQSGMPKGEVLQIKNLTWSYPDSRTLFSDFSMKLEKGKTVAVLGQSGVGKSTLVNILLGFLKPQRGEITLSEQNLLQYGETERLSLFSVVEQKPFFFHQTIYDNLHLANPSAKEEEMMEVLKKVALDKIITNLDEKLNTQLYEWGSNLSGGELQRLAIARALLKKAPFYIFDEPTAGMDSVNEKIIMDLIFQLSKDSGVLVITHRVNRLDEFDSVITLSQNFD